MIRIPYPSNVEEQALKIGKLCGRDFEQARGLVHHAAPRFDLNWTCDWPSSGICIFQVTEGLLLGKHVLAKRTASHVNRQKCNSPICPFVTGSWRVAVLG